ncbi:MAG: surfeit locus protein [Trichoglossum hirsutum]|nr:MAG: surfeit locus protein [Trichoglossum hirsutum]
MVDDLEERLKSHAKAFDGLLSLIPAKYYYGHDNSDQWRKKKQTKQEAKQAKLAKLDPDSAKSVKDVRDENERKRKRRGDDEVSDVEGIKREKPKEGLRALEKKPKKRKKDSEVQTDGSTAEKRTEDGLAPFQAEGSILSTQKSKPEKDKKNKTSKKKVRYAEDSNKSQLSRNGLLSLVKADKADSSLVAHVQDDATELDHTDGFEIRSNPSVTPTPAPESPNFDAPALQSGSSSISSIVPLISLGKVKRPSADPVELKNRLAARIEALRAARKADGPDGAPARNRQELMDARRRKEEQRRAHKKELKLKAKEDEKKEEGVAAASRTASLTLPNAEQVSIKEAPENNFSFGRVAFCDGQQLDSGLTSLLNPRKRKGHQDPLTAMKAAENKRARLNGLDEEKRQEIEEKDLWLNARKRAHGEKTKDDTVLLKKTLKRKEKVKKKSESEWKERVEGVEKGKAMRQKKREDNLRRRREEKGNKGKKKVGKSGKKVQRRPGFEGSFAAKIGGKRK